MGTSLPGWIGLHSGGKKDAHRPQGSFDLSLSETRRPILSQMAFKTEYIGGQGLPHAYRYRKKGKKEGHCQFLQVLENSSVSALLILSARTDIGKAGSPHLVHCCVVRNGL